MNYKLFPDFILRTPTLPFNKLDNILKNSESLMEMLSYQLINEAIFLASPVLSRELNKLKNGKIKESKEKSKLLNTTVKYISRMSTRCTPFGLFAGCSIGRIGDKTEICLNNTLKQVVRLDMNYLCSLYDYILKDPEIRKKIKLFPNTSLYPIGNKRYRYIECTQIGLKRKYHIAEIQKDSYLEKILRISKKGASINELAHSLTNEGISIIEASEFIEELINSHILEGELYQTLTGEDFLERIINLLYSINEKNPIIAPLEQINQLLKKISDRNENGIEIYNQISYIIESIGIQNEEKFLFQTDTIKSSSVTTIGKGVVDELYKTFEFLNKISSQSRNQTLDKFYSDFQDYYGTAEIPLTIALDPEIGIGYPSKTVEGGISPIVDDIILPSQEKPDSILYTPFQSILLKKVIESISNNGKEIVFTDSDVKDFEAKWDDLPLTMFSKIRIVESNSENNLIEMASLGGSSGANLIARFSHTDKNIYKMVKNITSKEQWLDPDRIYAEIVHLPESRTGNVLFRPHIRNYEILYMSYSDLHDKNILHVSDLMISVRNNRLILRSKRLNKEIVPRLTNAHNYRISSLPVYRFLCDMQTQSLRKELYFDWGNLKKELTFRPRIRFNNTIISAASWTVKIEEIKRFFEIRDDIKLLDKVLIWRKKRGIPTKILIPDADNELYINLGSITKRVGKYFY